MSCELGRGGVQESLYPFILHTINANTDQKSWKWLETTETTQKDNKLHRSLIFTTTVNCVSGTSTDPSNVCVINTTAINRENNIKSIGNILTLILSIILSPLQLNETTINMYKVVQSHELIQIVWMYWPLLYEEIKIDKFSILKWTNCIEGTLDWFWVWIFYP